MFVGSFASNEYGALDRLKPRTLSSTLERDRFRILLRSSALRFDSIRWFPSRRQEGRLDMNSLSREASFESSSFCLARIPTIGNDSVVDEPSRFKAAKYTFYLLKTSLSTSSDGFAPRTRKTFATSSPCRAKASSEPMSNRGRSSTMRWSYLQRFACQSSRSARCRNRRFDRRLEL